MLKRRTLKTALAAVISLAVMAAPAYANPGNGNGNGGGRGYVDDNDNDVCDNYENGTGGRGHHGGGHGRGHGCMR